MDVLRDFLVQRCVWAFMSSNDWMFTCVSRLRSPCCMLDVPAAERCRAGPNFRLLMCDVFGDLAASEV